MRARHGFSLVEAVIAMSIAGVLLAVAVPRFATVRANGAVHSAQSRIVSALATARAGAIQRSGTASVRLLGNRVTVVASGGALVLGESIPVDSLYGATLSVEPSGLTQIDYDARGFASLPTGVRIIVRRSGAVSDSICVTRLGVVRRTCATL